MKAATPIFCSTSPRHRGSIVRRRSAGAETHWDRASLGFLGLRRDPLTEGAPAFPPLQALVFSFDRSLGRSQPEMEKVANRAAAAAPALALNRVLLKEWSRPLAALQRMMLTRLLMLLRPNTVLRSRGSAITASSLGNRYRVSTVRDRSPTSSNCIWPGQEAHRDPGRRLRPSSRPAMRAGCRP